MLLNASARLIRRFFFPPDALANNYPGYQIDITTPELFDDFFRLGTFLAPRNKASNLGVNNGAPSPIS